MKLRQKLILAFLTVTVLPFGALLLGLPGPAIRQAEDLVGGRLEDNVEQTARAIDQFMINCIRDMKAFAADTDEYDDGVEKTSEFLDRVTYFYPYVRESTYADPHGLVIASSETSIVGRSIFDIYPAIREQYIASITSPPASVFVCNITEPGSANLRLMLLAPVLDESGKCRGVLVGLLVTQHLRDLLAEIDRRIPGEKHSALLDTAGHVIMSSARVNASADIKPDANIEKSLLKTQARRVGSGFVTYEDSTGEKVMSGYAHLWTYGANSMGDWQLVASAPYDSIMRPVRIALMKGAAILLIAVTMAGLAGSWLAHTLARPVLQLTDGARKIAQGDLSARVSVSTQDETGVLATSFNQMATTIQDQIAALRQGNDLLEFRVNERTAELAKINTNLEEEVNYRIEAQKALVAAQSDLAETSRQAGMAEVATSVLHNVGNVLNSVNVTTNLVSDRIQNTKAANISKIAALFEEHKENLANFITQDTRGKQVPAYLKTLAGHLDEEQRFLRTELQSLQKNVEHIKDIVAMQQSYAKVYGVTEVLAPSELVEDALHLNAGALVRHEVDVIREYDPVPEITVERHKVLQILVNLIRNAKYACDDTGRPDKWIRVGIHQDGDFVVIAIIDNGIGIPAENMDRIFAHGFTTRDLGHGFGLHNSALVSRELGGSLSARSGGPGMGATFTVRIPFTPPKPSV